MKILSVVGARPNFVKIGPLMREMARHPSIEAVLVHTGQHYDGPMSKQFFADLEIPEPDINLGVGSGSHAVQTAEVMKGLEPVLLQHAPDAVLVVGDVNSTLAAALVAVKLGIPVAHVEAGLRSLDRTMPEEINRIVTDAVADLLFVTEESGREHLLREGVAPGKIHFVGNVMIDSLEMSRPKWERAMVFETLGIAAGQPYAVLTLHRPSNVDDPRVLDPLLDALRTVAGEIPIVFPVHPRLKARLQERGLSRLAGHAEGPSLQPGLTCVDPMGYLDFVALMSRARLVLTDSGGIQEETTMLGTPCLTLRTNTERPVTVTQGTNRLVGTEPGRIVEEAFNVLAEPPARRPPPPLWDGQAAPRIVRTLLEMPASSTARAGDITARRG